MKNLAILILLVFAGSSCGVSKATTQPAIELIEFGGGGGFAGTVSKYILKADGQLTKSQGGAMTLIKRLSNDSTREVFKKALEFVTYNYNNPDNVYSFINIKTKDVENHIVWGLGSNKIDQNLVSLFTELMALCK